MSDGWAADVTAGHDSALLAWRREDVADLNRLARSHWARLGHLRGDDVHVDGGRRPYAVGDRLVALTPNTRAGIVTSEPLTVAALEENALTVRTTQGRQAILRGEEMDVKHLDYGYALTQLRPRPRPGAVARSCHGRGWGPGVRPRQALSDRPPACH